MLAVRFCIASIFAREQTGIPIEDVQSRNARRSDDAGPANHRDVLIRSNRINDIAKKGKTPYTDGAAAQSIKSRFRNRIGKARCELGRAAANNIVAMDFFA